MVRLGSLKEEITIYPLAPTEVDEFNNAIEGWGEGVTVEARVEPLSATELTDGRDTRINEYVAYTKPVAALTATSKVEWNGATYEVRGDPKKWTRLNGWASHCETVLKKVEG